MSPLMQRILRAVQRTSPAQSIPDPQQIQDLLTQGHRLHSQGELVGAESHYRQVLQLAPDHAPIRHLLGAVLAQSGKLEEARAELDRAVELDPNSATAWVDLGHTLRLKGEAVEAADCYRKALVADSDLPLAAVSLGELLLSGGKFADALEAFERALNPPADPRAVKGMVSALEGLDEPREARRRCEDILAREPDHAEAHASLGYLLL
jgi:Flp pilus assembly protein TadD